MDPTSEMVAGTATSSSHIFHLSQGTSHKFWSVQVEETVQTIRLNRIGSVGQTCKRAFPSQSEAATATK